MHLAGLVQDRGHVAQDVVVHEALGGVLGRGEVVLHHGPQLAVGDAATSVRDPVDQNNLQVDRDYIF